MSSFYHNNDVHNQSYSEARIAQNMLKMIETRIHLFGGLVCQIHDVEESENEHAAEKDAVAFVAEAKIKSIVSI